MALKATIFKAQLQLADMDRRNYADHAVTLARHPSETDERMMVRLLAFALHVPVDTTHGTLEFAKGLWDPDEPELWHKDLTGQIVHWIDVGQPDDRRLMKASGRAERVTVLSYSHSAPIWWSGIATKITRADNIAVWQIPRERVAGPGRTGRALDATAGHGPGRHALGLERRPLGRDHAAAPERLTAVKAATLRATAASMVENRGSESNRPCRTRSDTLPTAPASMPRDGLACADYRLPTASQTESAANTRSRRHALAQSKASPLFARRYMDEHPETAALRA